MPPRIERDTSIKLKTFTATVNPTCTIWLSVCRPQPSNSVFRIEMSTDMKTWRHYLDTTNLSIEVPCNGQQMFFTATVNGTKSGKECK